MGTLRKIYILHGWTASIDNWGDFLQSLKKTRFDPIMLKIPGLTKKIDQPWNLEKYVEWLKKEITEQEVILLGHSNGGRIAIAFANKYPQRVGQLILMDSAGIYHNEIPLRLKRFLFKNLAKFGKKITSSNKFRNLLYKLSREKDYKKATPMQQQTMINLISVDLTNILKSIKIPTLIIWGKHDKATPVTDGRLMNGLIKNSKLVILDAKHSPQFTNTKETVKEIIKFIK